MIKYDSCGVPMKLYGKRRPKIPKTIQCECGKIIEKVEYGTYECRCGLVYQYRYGKLVKGDVCWEYDFNIHKTHKCYSFPVD